MADEPMSDERLAEIREYAFREPPATLKYAIMNSTAAPLMVFINMAWSQRHELLAEVDRLRAREAAAMAIVEKLVSLWLVTDDSHAPRRLTYLYPRDGAVDVEALREEARALLTQE